jgi:hypothetical protein
VDMYSSRYFSPSFWTLWFFYGIAPQGRCAVKYFFDLVDTLDLKATVSSLFLTT